MRKAFTPPATADGVPDIFAVEQAMDRYATTMIPLQRWGSPADIANMVAFRASPGGAWITGAIMVVDGGMVGEARCGALGEHNNDCAKTGVCQLKFFCRNM